MKSAQIRNVVTVFQFFIFWTVVTAAEATAQAGAPPFSVACFPTNPQPDSIVSGDLNQDGVPDLVTGHLNPLGGAQNITVHFSDGRGGVATSTALDTGGSVVAELRISDINNDGKNDILAAIAGNFFSGINTFSTWTSSGGGAFGPRVDYLLSLAPVSLDLADVNQDGVNDAMVATSSSNIIYILHGSASGTYQIQAPIFTNAGFVRARFADVTQDGVLDIAGVRTQQILSIFQTYLVVFTGAGGGFPAPETDKLIPENGPAEMLVDDFTNNGIPDIVLSFQSAIGVKMAVGTGAGAFSMPQIISGSGYMLGLAKGLFNADGALDLMAVETTGGLNSANLIINNSNGTFTAADRVPVGPTPRRIAAADFDLDGIVDMAVTITGNSSVAIVRGKSNNIFNKPTVLASPARNKTLLFNDMNLDGAPDVVSCFEGLIFMGGQTSPGGVGIAVGDGAGNFAPFANTTITFGQSGHAVGDINKDGKPDTVTVNANEKIVRTLLGDGAGGFGSILQKTLAAAPLAVEIGDMNADGNPDLCVANYLANQAQLLLGNGAGQYASGAGNIFATGAMPVNLKIGDLNQDGYLDIVTCNKTSADVSILLTNNAAAVFLPAAQYPAGGNSPVAIALGDANYNGHLDLAIASSGGASTLVNNGAGAFGPATLYPSILPASAIVYTDVSGDGYHDICYALENVRCVAVQKGDGTGAFGNIIYYYDVISPTSLAAGDIDADGRIDIATDGYSNGSLVVQRNLVEAPAQSLLYGNGTAGCAGRHGLTLGGNAKINSTKNSLISTQTPSGSLGLGIATNIPDLAGSDAFGLGVMVHVDMINSTFVQTFDMYSDLQGMGFANFDIPNDPGLIGAIFYLQSFHITDNCKTTPIGLTSSRGLQLQILP